MEVGDHEVGVVQVQVRGQRGEVQPVGSRKLVKIVGPSLTDKKLTVQILQEIDRQIEMFLLVQVFTSTVVAALDDGTGGIKRFVIGMCEREQHGVIRGHEWTVTRSCITLAVNGRSSLRLPARLHELLQPGRVCVPQ